MKKLASLSCKFLPNYRLMEKLLSASMLPEVVLELLLREICSSRIILIKK